MYFDYFFSPLQVVYDSNTLYIFAPNAQSRDQWVRNLKEGNGNCFYLNSNIGRYLCLSCLQGLELVQCFEFVAKTAKSISVLWLLLSSACAAWRI